ncbi:MAG: hypothetical protein HYW90_03615 [Candidatus Sungbacteria bacterium]|nr:hypothetical protein [Candidatus Sungbacteria bacterium]
MPHVSRNKLDKETLRSLHDRFIELLAGTTHQGDLNDILSDLLTKTERIMIAKRLAIVVMLYKGYPFGIISRTLKVSEATISVMKDRMDRGGGGFEKAVVLLEKDRKLEMLFAKLDRIIRLFALPPIAGKGRWRFLHHE